MNEQPTNPFAGEEKQKFDLNKIDYEWVQKTHNKKELHQAYRALEEDGYFEELQRAVGEKLAEVDPVFARKFHAVKLSSAETRAINDELNDFFENAKKLDNSLRAGDGKENIFSNGTE